MLVLGDGPAGEAVIARLRAVECVVRTDLGDERAGPVDDALVSFERLDGEPREVASRVFEVVGVLEHTQRLYDRKPRHVVVIVGSDRDSQMTTLAARLVRTLVVYLTGHTAGDDVRINAIRYRVSAGADACHRAADVALVLAGGLLDAVRGQVLDVEGLDGRVIGAAS